MFGKNIPLKIERDPTDGRLAIQEVFYTLQGEGPFTGHPAVFIRLAGCHLACTFCDTEFSSNIDNRLRPDEIVEAAIKTLPLIKGDRPLPLIVLTGGEPMRQDLGLLCELLLHHRFPHIQIETAGNLWDPKLEGLALEGKVTIVVSPKTPQLHPRIRRHAGAYKYIIRAGETSAEDGLPIMGTQANVSHLRPARPLPGSTTPIYVSPCDDYSEEENEANRQAAVRVALEFGYILSLQTHKLVGLR